MDITAAAQAAQPQSTSSSAFSSLTANLDTFLTLLTTQLQNQDPLEPLDTEQFTQQLVQFAGVEQSIQTNANLETLIALQSSSDRSSALDLIGRAVTISSDAARHDGDGAQWTYETPLAASAISLSIVDANNTVVATAVGSPGAQSYVWDGKTNTGARAPDGVYRLSVTAVDASGNALSTQVQTQTTVSGAVFNDGLTQLETPAGLVSIDAVRRASTQE